MKLSAKRLIFNKYTVLTVVLYFIVGIISWCLTTGIIGLLIHEYAPQERQDLILGTFRLDIYINSFFHLVEVFIPFAAALLSAGFLDEKRGYFKFAYMRNGKYKSFIRERIIKYALCTSLVLSVLYLIVVLIGLCFNKPVVGSGMGILSNFTLFVGEGRNPQKLVIRYFLKVLFLGILLPFAYSMLSIAVSFITNKKYVSIIAPFIYTILGSQINGYIFLPQFDMSIPFSYFTDSCKGFKLFYFINIEPGRYPGMMFFYMMPAIFLIIISVVIIEIGLRRRERFAA